MSISRQLDQKYDNKNCLQFSRKWLELYNIFGKLSASDDVISKFEDLIRLRVYFTKYENGRVEIIHFMPGKAVSACVSEHWVGRTTRRQRAWRVWEIPLSRNFKSRDNGDCMLLNFYSGSQPAANGSTAVRATSSAPRTAPFLFFYVLSPGICLLDSSPREKILESTRN